MAMSAPASAQRALMALLCSSLMTGALAAQNQPAPAPSNQPGKVQVPPQTENSQVPQLKQISPYLNLGYHPPMKLVSDTMTFENISDKPIEIERAVGECSCTDATVLSDTMVVQPGASVDILIAVEFPREVGIFEKSILIYEKGNPTPRHVPFSFEVGYPVRVNGGARHAIVYARTGVIKLDSVDKTPFNVLTVHGRQPMYEGYEPGQPIRPAYSVVFDWTAVHAEKLPRWMIIETDHPGAEMLAVPAMVEGYRIIRDEKSWKTVDPLVVMGPIPSESPSVIEVLFSGKPVIPNQKVRVLSSNPNVDLRVVGVRKPYRGGGMVIQYEVSPRNGYEGFLETIVTTEYDGSIAMFDLFARSRKGAPPYKESTPVR
ncbi:MAG: DUF1573 domain-containing protein [Planctomycetota bacterium]|nr:DUF1573 domain-containing protein [Planctomycetota bacterium]